MSTVIPLDQAQVPAISKASNFCLDLASCNKQCTLETGNMRTWQSAGVKRLFDLVKVRDDALRVAFYFGLGNTLVAADLEQASRIAYGSDKRWSRVVTMQV